MPDWHAAANHYRVGGADRVLEVVSARGLMPAWLFHYYRVDLLQLENLNSRAMRPGGRYQYGPAQRCDAEELAAVSNPANRESMKRSLESFFDRGNKCFVARREGRVVGYVWTWHSTYTITNDHYRMRQFHLRLRPDEVVFGDGYIDEGYRLRGLYPELIRVAVASYPKEFMFYSVVARLNDHSMKSTRRLGFAPRLTVACRRLGGLPYCWTVSEPGGPLRFLAWKRPTVDLACLLGRRLESPRRTGDLVFPGKVTPE